MNTLCKIAPAPGAAGAASILPRSGQIPFHTAGYKESHHRPAMVSVSGTKSVEPCLFETVHLRRYHYGNADLSSRLFLLGGDLSRDILAGSAVAFGTSVLKCLSRI